MGKPRKPLTQLAYRGTTVDYTKTQKTINLMLRKHDIHNVTHPMGYNDNTLSYVCATQFMYAVETEQGGINKVPVIIMIEMQTKPTDGRAYDLEANQLYRAIHWYIKVRLEGIDFGFDVLEQFLPNIRVRGPDGQIQSMYDLLLPKFTNPQLEDHSDEIVDRDRQIHEHEQENKEVFNL